MKKPRFTTLLRVITVYTWGGTSGVARMFIDEGKITVNGKVSKNADMSVGKGDIIHLKGATPETSYTTEITEAHLDYLCGR